MIMQFSRVAIISTLLAVASASAVPMVKRATCTAVLEGVNSEGGGGPGQAPINNNNYGFSITGGSNGDYHKDIGTEDGSFDFTVGEADYGGSHNMDVRGSWNYGGNDWSYCGLSLDGGDFMVVDATQNIESGTVSETIADCTWTFDC